MAMQVKHMLTVGLGLGVATALGYHFLASPQYDAVSENTSQMAPLSRFELSPTPVISEPLAISESPAILETPTILAQPPVDSQFRSEATPLRPSTFDQPALVESNTSYNDLVAAAQATAPAAASPAGFPQLDVETEPSEKENSEDGFSLDLSAPDAVKAPEFVFEEQESTLQQTQVQAPTSLQLDQTFTENNDEAVEVIASQSRNEFLAEVVDYNSKPIDRSSDENQESKENVWKENPFINNGTVASVAAKPTLPASIPIQNIPEPFAQEQNLPTPTENVVLPHASSVLSLKDPAHEGLVAVVEPVQTMSAAAIPDSIQPYQQTPLANDQMANHAAQITPSGTLPMNSADTLKAVHHIEYGKTLSRRGASHTARQEFLSAMQLISAANDKISGDNRHTKALRFAMLSMKEASDFSVASSEQQIQMDVASVVESHRSKVLTAAQAANLSPIQAMNRYFASAQEQLDLAGGRNVVSAEVFYCMGKLQTVLSRSQKVLGPYETANSVVYHQAALLCDNQHHRSANELGVLLARSGRLEQAKLLFERSLISQPTVRTWQNLAEAHRRLGEVEFANQAVNEVQMLASGQLPATQSIIQWKPIDQFNADAPVEFNQRVAELPSPPARSASPSDGAAEDQAPPKTVVERLKRMF